MARVTVLGRSGTGKSHKIGEILEKCLDPNHPDNGGESDVFDAAVHFDLEDEEKGLSDPDHNPIYKTLPVTPEKAEKLSWIKVIWNHRRIRVVPEDMTLDQATELYARIAEAAMKFAKELDAGSILVSCDEAHNLISQTSFPDSVERMITGGRKHGCECVHASQRPQLLHTTVISQADLRVYFSITDDNDLAKIDSVSSFPAQILTELPSRVCVVENKNTGEAKVVVTDADYANKVPETALGGPNHGIEMVVDESSRIRPHYSGDDGIIDQAFQV